MTIGVLEGVALEHVSVAVDGIRLHVVQAGPRDGPLVLLLHGFPESWYGWRRQIPHLARTGCRVWAPDGRGYGGSDKPSAIRAYAVDELTRDVVGLIAASGRERATVVGHDWGGVVAWRLAMRHAGSLASLVVLNAPHPAAMARALRWSLRQVARSAYAAFFQIPVLPEAALRARGHRLLVRALERTSREGAFTAEDLAVHRGEWEQPGALRGMLDWYRAALRHPPTDARDGRVTVPTLLLWGVHDPFLGPELAVGSASMCDDARLEPFPGATHWLQHEEPEGVNGLVRSFVR
jgi:epoxide hydrolase 4